MNNQKIRSAGEYSDRVQEMEEEFKGFPKLAEAFKELSSKVSEDTFNEVVDVAQDYQERDAISYTEALGMLAEVSPRHIG